MEERKMTIARGLTRLKTIKGQLDQISSKIQQYAAWSDKEKHPYGANGSELKKNHEEARKEIESLYQQHNDLRAEFMKISLAIQKANFETTIIIGDKTMTIAEALIYKQTIAHKVQTLVSCYGIAVNAAQNKVHKYNQPYANVTDENAKKAVLADILYLVDREKVKELDSFLVEFMLELDGTLNEVNALTEITL